MVTEYDARRAAGDPGMPSQRQPSNPRAFLRPQVAVPARPSAAVSAAALARTIGLTEGDRKFLAAALATLANEVERPRVTPAVLAKEVFATPHFQDALKANDIPDREEFKDRFAAAVADVAAAHKVGRAVKLARADYASGPNVSVPPGHGDREVAVVPTTACLRCHDVAGVGRPAFNPIPKLAFDPFDRAAREAWVRSNDARTRDQVLGRMLKRVATDRDMPPEDAPEYEAFRAKDPAAFDALTGWLEAELKRAKGN
jgi:cytochrome c553